MKKKLVYIGFTYPHHKNTHAGYNRIKDFLPYNYIIDCDDELHFLGTQPNNILIRIFRKIYRVILGTGAPLNIIKCIFISLFSKNVVFHFIYPELTYKWLHLFKRNNKIVFTIHQPYEVLIKTELHQYIKYADALILMSNKDTDKIKTTYCKDKVLFIPHGIDTEFYSPTKEKVSKNQICMIGSWLRDFETASYIFNEIHCKYKDVEITVVTNKENFDKLPSFVNKRTKLSDNELLEIYNQSKCMFLPLKSFTANNAVLEAASTNCPIVILSNNIDTSYLGEELVYYTKDIENAIQLLEGFVRNENKGKKESRDFVIKNFSWQTIAKQTYNFIKSI